MWVFTSIVKSSLSKRFSKFSRKHSWWSPVLSGIPELLAWNFSNTGLCEGYFSKSIQLLIKLHIAFCITLYYTLAVVSNFFNGKHLIKRKIYMLNFVLKKLSKCVLKITAHKPWDSFQKYFRVDANHLSCWPKMGNYKYTFGACFS